MEIDKGLTLDEYRKVANTTAVYPEKGTGSLVAVNYAAIGLSNEAGEVLGKVKKCWRDDGMVITAEKSQAIIDELGDVMWYAQRLADELEVDLMEVMRKNAMKLLDRKARGVIKGSGDNR